MLGNKKGSVVTLVFFLMGVVVAVALLPEIARTQESMVQEISVINYSFSAPAAGSSVDLPGQELVSYSAPKNGSAVGEDIPTSNYTVAEGVSPRTGLKRIIYTAKGGNFTSATGTTLWITYTYNPEGYADDAGARALINQLVLFATLALLGYVIWASGLFDQLREWGGFTD